ncbi:MAG: hypothetical protein LQ350_008349 [Teloschistes chrysophthalmus]|nr:MAG: hypothetical protein LQ350_008349 [Niorma chrysophthalma]
MFDDLWRRLDLTRDDIATVAKTIPRDVHQAYTAILDKSPDKSKARKLLHIILAAMTPLSIEEVNVVMVVGESTESYKDLEWWVPETAGAERIKNTCGLFVSVVDSKVYLIHQTAREFLIGNEHNGWCESFNPARSNLVLAEACIWFLRLKDLENRSQVYRPQEPECAIAIYDEARYNRKRYHRYENRDLDDSQDTYVLLSYVATNWSNHLTLAGNLAPAALIEVVAQELCDPLSYSLETWAQIYEALHGIYALPGQASKLTIASFLGLDRAVAFLLEQENHQLDLEHRGESNPLSWAARNGHQNVTELLLARDHANAGLSDLDGRTPLHWAALNGHQDVIKLLLAREDVNAALQGKRGRTPVQYAAERGHKEALQLLLEHDPEQADVADTEGRTPLSYAAQEGYESLVNILLQRNVDIESKNEGGRTPLSAAGGWADEIVKILLESGAHVDSQDIHGRTALHWTVMDKLLVFSSTEKRVLVIVALLENGAEINHKDSVGRTPLSNACYLAEKHVVYLEGTLDEDLVAADHRYWDYHHVDLDSIELLLEKGADIDSEDSWMRTPLFYAACNGATEIVEMLLQSGARLDSRTIEGNTPLDIAKSNGHEEVVQLIENHLAQNMVS